MTSIAGQVALIERGEQAGFPGLQARSGDVFGFSIPEGETAWRTIVPTLSPADTLELSRLLDVRAERQQAEQDRLEREERLNAPPDEEAAGLAKIEAEAQRQAYEAARPQRIEAFLSRIADAVETLARR